LFVEALVAQSAVKALDAAILHRFARRNVVPYDVALLLPGQEGAPCAASNQPRIWALADNTVHHRRARGPGLRRLPERGASLVDGNAVLVLTGRDSPAPIIRLRDALRGRNEKWGVFVGKFLHSCANEKPPAEPLVWRVACVKSPLCLLTAILSR
jgi:hypothetical protein